MILVELAKYLQSQNFGTVGTNIFAGRGLQESPDEQIAFFVIGDQEPNRYVNVQTIVFQIEVRRKRYEDAKTVDKEIYDLLHKTFMDTVKSNGEYVILALNCTQHSTDEGEDQNRHNVVSSTYSIMYEYV
jgi:hypothetical protein